MRITRVQLSTGCERCWRGLLPVRFPVRLHPSPLTARRRCALLVGWSLGAGRSIKMGAPRRLRPCRGSSARQSSRLVSGRSGVQIPSSARIIRWHHSRISNGLLEGLAPGAVRISPPPPLGMFGSAGGTAALREGRRPLSVGAARRARYATAHQVSSGCGWRIARARLPKANGALEER